MRYTMRSAFKRWCILHNEESRIRIPNWFRYYIRENTQWKYIVIDEAEDYYCNKCEMDYEQRRQYKGYYIIEISDEELSCKQAEDQLSFLALGMPGQEISRPFSFQEKESYI